MTDQDIIDLERVLAIAETRTLDSRWPNEFERALAALSIRNVRDFIATRGFGMPDFDPEAVAYLPDQVELDQVELWARAEADSRVAEAYAYFHDMDSDLGLGLDAEDIESMAVELADKTQRRAAAI